MTEIIHTRSAEPFEHEWIEHDRDHRECRRCGTRLLWQNGKGWLGYDRNGVWTSPRIGGCSGRPEAFGDLVLIDYTGNPDVYPGCERFMHQLKHADPALARAGAAQVARCGYAPEFWEIGTIRDHVGWTFCLACFGVGRTRPIVKTRAPSHVALPPAPRVRLPQRPPPKGLLPTRVGISGFHSVTGKRK